jgi:hypothetical protein
MRSRDALILSAVLATLAVAGCSREHEDTALTFESLPDTAGLTQGADVLTGIEARRGEHGSLQVSGHLRLPDGTRLQVTVRRVAEGPSLAMAHVTVKDMEFVTPPLMGDSGPLPRDTYLVEVLGHFTQDWQTAEVMRATGDGMRLRGPGITRSQDGRAAFQLTREMTL